MKIKPGVSIKKLTPQMVLGHFIVCGVYEQEYNYECVITCGDNGAHKVGSKHPDGNALDYRTKHLPDMNTRHAIKAHCAEELGENYDVVLEADHLHVEFDPK